MDSGVRSSSTFKHPGLILTIMAVAIVLSAIVFVKMNPPAPPTTAEIKMTLALQHVEKGDIVRFGENNFRMVANRIGNDIHFKVPMCDGLPASMPISLVAQQATDVIKYNSTSVAWTNAAYMLMTGEYVPEKSSRASR